LKLFARQYLHCHNGTLVDGNFILLPIWHLLLTSSIHFTTQVKQREVELTRKCYGGSGSSKLL
jgi:hypothetical protein